MNGKFREPWFMLPILEWQREGEALHILHTGGRADARAHVHAHSLAHIKTQHKPVG